MSKRSPLGVIPDSWDYKTLSEVTVKITDRDHTTPKYVDSGVPIVSPTNIDNGHRLVARNLKYITEEAHQKNRKKTDLEPGDIIFSRIGAALGKSYKVSKEFWNYSILHSLCQIRVREDIETDYVLYVLKSDYFQHKMWFGVQSIGVPDLGLKEIGHLPILVPSIPEQKKIAEILTSVDKVIELTEIEIEKLKNLKKGMMQDLLTKGIGHTKFKDSPIGKIPESWEVKSVQDIARVVDSLHKTPKFADSGYYMIRVTDIVEGNLRFDNSLKVSKEVYQDFSRNHKPVRGDIVMTRVGSFGRSSYVDTDVDFCIGQNTVVINPEENSKYLYYFLNSEVVWNQILNETNGSSQGSLSLKAIKELNISIPKKEELDKIVSSLDSISNQIELKIDKLNKVQDVKRGLMQDLLTGKVRVKV